MKILIVGAGVVGTSLAEQLSGEGHDILIMDQDAGRVQDVEDKLDVLAVHGHAGLSADLDKSGIRDADMVIAVTDVDEVNLVVGMFAKRYGVNRCIIRIRDHEFLDRTGNSFFNTLGIDHVINPDPIIAGMLEQTVDIPGAISVSSMVGGRVLLLGFEIADDSIIAGRPLAELRREPGLDSFLVLCLIRDEKTIVPSGDDRMLPGDRVYLLVPSDLAHHLPSLIHPNLKPVNSVIISGASRVGILLAAALQKKIPRVSMIEADKATAEAAKEKLTKVNVLQGEETDLDRLFEVGLDRADIFFAVSEDEQKNMLSSLVAKRHGARRTVLLVNQPQYISVMNSLGVVYVLNPRLVTVGEILIHIRKGMVLSVTRLPEGEGEIIVFEAEDGCPAVKKSLVDLKFPKGALIGAIIREGEVIIPKGDTRIRPGESVIVFSLPGAIAKVEKSFTSRKRRGK